MKEVGADVQGGVTDIGQKRNEIGMRLDMLCVIHSRRVTGGVITKHVARRSRPQMKPHV